MGVMIWLLWFILAGLGLGRIARRVWRSKDEPFLDRFVIDISMGLGMLSLVFFTMAALNLLHNAHPGLALPGILLICISIIGFSLLNFDVVPLLVDWFKQKRWPSAAAIIWSVLFICLALLVLIPAMAPPSGSDWDSLAYHLSIPKLYLQHGGFYYINFVSHSNFPFLVEMLYIPALSLNSPAGAKLVHYLYGVLLVLAVVMLVRKHFNAKAAPLAALALAGMPIVMWEATTAYIDLATALYTVVAVYLLLEYFNKAELRSLVGCGIAVGFAASTKMTALSLIPLLGAWLLVDRWAETRHIEWKRMFTFAGIALLVCSPWYLKTLIYTGNPVYPFFYSIFGGKNWTAELAQNYATAQAKFGVGHNIASFLMLPFDLTFNWARFYDTASLVIGPILLVATPLMLLVRYRSRKLLGLVLFFIAQMAIWFVLTQQSRYLISSFAILAVIIAAIAYSDEKFRIMRIALYIVFGLTATFGVLTLIPAAQYAVPVVFGSTSSDEYLSRTLPIYPAEKWMNDNLPYDAKVALFGDTRGFYLNRDYVWADWGHNTIFSRNFASADEFTKYLKEQGITHAMINFSVFPARSGAKGTAELVYKAIDKGQFEQIDLEEWGGDAESVYVGVYKIR